MGHELTNSPGPTIGDVIPGAGMDGPMELPRWAQWEPEGPEEFHDLHRDVPAVEETQQLRQSLTSELSAPNQMVMAIDIH